MIVFLVENRSTGDLTYAISDTPKRTPTGPHPTALLKHGLGLGLVEPADLDTPVRGAHTIEIEHPARWLQPGWVMLTTGLRFVDLVDSSAAQRELVAELADAGVAGLLFGVGVHFADIPRPLALAARQHQLPLLTVPAEVPFFQVEHFVNQSLLSRDAYELKRSLWLQNDLLHALAEDTPVTALVNRIGYLLRGAAVLYEDSGRIVAATGASPSRLIWTEIENLPAGPLRFSVGRWHVAARPIVVRGTGYWIAVASLRPAALDEVGTPLLETTQRLLAAIRGARALSLSQERAESLQLLTVLRQGITAEHLSQTWERMRPLRFTPYQRVRAVSASQREPEYGDDLDELLQGAHTAGLAVLLAEDVDEDGTNTLTGLAADSAVLHGWLGSLSGSYDVGASEPTTDLLTVPSAFRDAAMAHRVARRSHAYAGGTDAVYFEQVDLATWLLASRTNGAIEAKIQEQFSDLFGHEDLLETVVAYLSSGLDVRDTAQRLYLHPNSIRYRIRKIESVLGAPLNSPPTLTNLYLALHTRVTL